VLYHRGYVVFASIALVGLLALAGCGGGGEEKSSSAPLPAPAPQQQTVAKPAITEAMSVEEGKKLFQQTCSACHGMNAKGLPKLGKDLTVSTFVKSQSDKELLTFIKQGRMPGDPLNTTGVAMPPKGGNPALQDKQLQAIIAYIRTLQG
jgi:cytochrome c5